MKKVKEIFGEALEHSGAAREDFLERACGGDQDLRGEVEGLLAALDEAGTGLSGAATAALAGRPPERPGTIVGRYKLLEQIGEGGFGVVYMAEQDRPLRRRVALKIIKPGMDTRQVIARFEAERQAL